MKGGPVRQVLSAVNGKLDDDDDGALLVLQRTLLLFCNSTAIGSQGFLMELGETLAFQVP